MALARNLKSNKTIEQLKARHLEIAALGACQFSFYTNGLERLFDIGKDIHVYPNIDELIYMIGRIDDDQAAISASSAADKMTGLSYQEQFSKLLA
jgi:spore maturation protein CgeB